MRKTLALAMLAALAGSAAIAGGPTVPELLPLVPQKAQVVVALDAAALRSHPLVQGWLLDHAGWRSSNGDAARFLAEAGLDPVRDVTAMVVAFASSDSHGEPVAFFAGRFDQAALATALTARGATPVALGSVPSFRLPKQDSCGGSMVVAQPSPELIVVGSEALVGESLGARSGRNALLDSALGNGQVDPRAPFWAVAAVPAELRRRAAGAASGTQGDAPEPLRDALIASGVVQSVALQATLDDALGLSGVATADTAENAELLRDAVKGALAAVRLRFQDTSPELVGVLRDVQVRAAGSQVTFSGAIPVALLEKLVADHRNSHSLDKPAHS